MSQRFPGLRVAGAREGGRQVGRSVGCRPTPRGGGWESAQGESQVGTRSAVEGSLSRKPARHRTDSP